MTAPTPTNRQQTATTASPRLPDFLVIGAQKSGTTDLCNWLSSHPGIYFSEPKELYFFDRDDIEVLPYPFFERYSEWEEFDWSERKDALIERYSRHFELAGDRLCGEGTPYYLPSRLAAEKVRETCPDAKLIVILRNPVDRAYSAYWQHVKMRRSTETFENHIRYERGGTLEFGHYETQLRYWASLFGRSRIHVVLFEEYVRDRHATAATAFGHLGLDVPPEPATPPSKPNTARVPRSMRFQRLLNRAHRAYPAQFSTIEYERQPKRSLPELAVSKVIRGLGRLNLGLARYPSMRAETRAKLDTYYRRRNRGLSEFLGRDLDVWGW